MNNVPVGCNDSCNILNDVFVSHFSRTTPTCYLSISDVNFLHMLLVSFDSFGIDCLIHNLKISACEGITYSFFILTNLFSQALQCCTMPNDWKVIPLHKSGDVHSPLIYRRISVTSVLCKLLEHIIYSHLIAFLESNSFFTNCQHGFRKYYSCETQLVSFTNDSFCAV